MFGDDLCEKSWKSILRLVPITWIVQLIIPRLQQSRFLKTSLSLFTDTARFRFGSVELKFVASEMLRRQNETKEVGALTSPQNSQDWYESTCAVGRAVWNEVMEITDNRTLGVWVRVHGSVEITTFKCRWDSFLQLCHLCSQPFAHNVNDLEPPRPSKTKSKKKNRTNG